MTLKVGDKVKTHHGTIGVVVALRSPGFCDVKGPGIPDCSSETPGAGTFRTENLEKIEDPAPKFKVGDRVRLPEWVHTERTGTVVRVSTATDTCEVMADGGFTWSPGCAHTPGAGSFSGSDLTKIEQSVPFFLRNGDIVVNRKTGRKGEVIRGMVYDVNDTFRPTCKGVPAAAVEEYEDHFPGTYDLIKKDAPW